MIFAGSKRSKHENKVVDVRNSADLIPPGAHDAGNVEAKKEGEQTRQVPRSLSPLFVLLLRPLSATLDVLFFGKLKCPVGSEDRQASIGVWAFLTFCLAPDTLGAKIATVCLVIQLHYIVEEKKDGREPDHPLDGEEKGSTLEGIHPGGELCPRRLPGFTTSLG